MRNITRRIWSFVLGGILLAAGVGGGIYFLAAQGNTVVGAVAIAAGVMASALVSCLFFGNNFVGEMMANVFSWGFVSMPGLIFELDLDGIIWLLTVKLLFWILGFVLAILCGILAIALGLIVSIFVYPYALVVNLRSNPDAIED